MQNGLPTTTIRKGTELVIKGERWTVDSVEKRGAQLILSSDYARTEDDRLCYGFTGVYYTVSMFRQMLACGQMSIEA